MVTKILIALAAALFLLFAGGVWYINYVYIPRTLKPLAVAALEREFQKPVSIEQAVYFPFKGIRFLKLRIDTSDNIPWLSAAAVDLQVRSLPRITAAGLSGKIYGEVTGFVLAQDALRVSGDFRWEGEFRARRNGPVFSGRMTVHDAAAQGIAPLADISGVSGSIVGDGAALQSEQLRGSIGGMPVEFSVRLRADEDTLRVELLQAISGSNIVRMQAQASRQTPAGVAWTLQAQLESGEIGRFLSGVDVPPLQGVCRLSVSGTSAGAALRQMRAAGKLEAAEIAGELFSLFQLTAPFVFEQGMFTASDVRAVLWGGTLQGKAQINVCESGRPLSAAFDAVRLSASEAVRRLFGYDVGRGELTAHLEVRGPMRDAASLQGSGWVRLDKGAIQAPQRWRAMFPMLDLSAAMFEQATATLQIGDGRLHTDDLLIQSSVVQIRGKGAINFARFLEGEVALYSSEAFARQNGIPVFSAPDAQRHLLVATCGVKGTFPNQLRWHSLTIPVEQFLRKALPQQIQDTIDTIDTNIPEQPADLDAIKKQLQSISE
ncbi:MAG: AsmA-like C-terminal region-containing protein [Candidatus Omnitrophica bacterium]|nr:AsmA-like C-terminal region-containing protein [Candidatus Omnitrophota bacterium]